MDEKKTDCARELMAAVLATPAERQNIALRFLRGELEEPARACLPEKYETLKEVGRQLGYHPCTLWRFGVPGHSLGGRRRFKVSEVQSYLESPTFEARAAALRAERRAKVHAKEIQ
ncbi:MAG: hypothetical protein NTY53_21995 [Kiritimatiellaeota bacterium]|nr:hypothetical protein [Kiritimatiellota bacterium]